MNQFNDMANSGTKHEIDSKETPLSIRAAQFLQEIDDALPLLKRRNAINKKVRVFNIALHRMKPTLMKEFTVCSQCRELIWAYGLNCEQCNLMTHRKCEGLIRVPCSKADQLDHLNQCPHKFMDTFFYKPTYCGHCGTLLLGFISKQGVKCSSCDISFHFGCKTLTGHCLGKSSRSIVKNSISSPQVECKDSDISIQDFDMLRILGVGSFSKVYLARLKSQRSTETDVKFFAIKVLKKADIEMNINPDSALVELRSLNLGRKCPFLCVSHCCFQSKNRLFFVMEYVVGKDLLYHIRKSRKFSEHRSRIYSAEVIIALIFLHEQGLVYRDVKLDNVILDREGHCKLIDFGMVKDLKKIRQTKTFCGTPSYMAPEMIREEPYDYSIDWWSLGVMMYEMMTGCPLFDADYEDEIYKKVLYEPVDLSRAPSAQAELIMGDFLIKDPKCRLGSRCSDMTENHLEIKEHQYFARLWEDIESRRTEPPYIPTKSDIQDENSDLNLDGNMMTSSELNSIGLSPDDEDTSRNIHQSDFQDFSFYSESFKMLANLDA